MEFRIEWFYPKSNQRGSEESPNTFVQIVDADRFGKKGWFPQFCGGSYIVNLINAGYAGKELSLDQEKFSQIFRDCFQLNVAELYSQTTFGYLCAHCDVIASIAKAILYKIKKDCNTQQINIPASFQQSINSALTTYNGLVNQFWNCLNSNSLDDDENFYDILKAELRKYNDGKHPLIKQFLDTKGKDGLCFAAFVEEPNRNRYVAFSGFTDCEDAAILHWLKRKKQAFVDIAKAICESCDAELVQTNPGIKTYSGYCLDSISVSKSLAGAMLHKKGPNEEKQYACAERKIYSKWNDDTPSGNLYVKYPMCLMCYKGYNYQIRGGRKQITVYDGLL